ncbi:DUF2523 family protein [Pseudoteredinibacter isoporae]|uniref:DUF2523 domain-containing protein n=1 Tax=Pseudoteredinibacter isoporae TaxID=570281 RepID=A0A7X0MXJ8_9GAMM|nr:DUF2523 family protein [Pseudoteredinibacter isoporae]MBB6523846.1 hypothetical protein [Pseudoteredinibacter isoporae]MBB6523896.1 hypothetical protein [Pseudoteredinibacter isoporae]NHO89363.1 DUF2523 domain-containing protein [Pseudoteredinibacter isoporae]NHO89396.1 DUF2523 domain-containing protein [Pseudoteredinibacter isoporae]NIB22470.1 DUF2523 domain-containing protein [Pseudoteredinibacter isoporae]
MPLPAIVGAAVLPTLAAFLIRALVAHLIMRTITSLGIFILSFAAIETASSRVTSYFEQALNSVSGDAYFVADMLGFFDCANIIISAYAAALSIRQIRGAYNRLIFGQNKE